MFNMSIVGPTIRIQRSSIDASTIFILLKYLIPLLSPINLAVQGGIIVTVTFLFLASAWSGLSKGIKYLSNINMVLASILLLCILIVGPTMLILNMLPTA